MQQNIYSDHQLVIGKLQTITIEYPPSKCETEQVFISDPFTDGDIRCIFIQECPAQTSMVDD